MRDTLAHQARSNQRRRAPRAWLFWAALLAALCLAPSADAQLQGLQLPALPQVGLPPVLSGTVNELTRGLGDAPLANLRLQRVQQLLRANRALLERDPNGNPVLRSQIVALSPSDEILASASSLGYSVLRERVLEGLNVRVVVLGAPARWTTRRALARLRERDPDGSYDFDHVYLESGETVSAAANSNATTLQAPEAVPDSNIRIGLIDGGIDTAHPVFRDARIHAQGCNGTPVASAHGTAIASLLIGRSASFTGVVPGAELFAADVYCGLPTGGAVDAVVDALAWIARSQVPVVNVSLVGPPNATLEHVVRLIVARGCVIVAAVGNGGPAAPPLYPASYPGVIGVTGVDAKRNVLLEAARGPQVSFAAPGADMLAAQPLGAYGAVRGTSFAAPIVAGLLAKAIIRPGAVGVAAAISELKLQAIDLGTPGFDPVSGYGLVGEALRIPPTALSQVGR